MTVERLTYYDCAGAACFDYERPVMNGVMANKAISRLAKYEDTGLTPEDCAAYAKAESEKRIVVFENYDELNKVRELLQAEREGRLVVLPFLPGEEVYYITSGEKPQIKKCRVWQYHFGEKLSVSLSISKNGVVVCPISQVYKTREEAEAALEKQEGAEHERD